LRAYKGGAVAVCVAVEEREPRVILSTVLKTCREGDRLSLEPYRQAYDLPRAPDGGASAEAVALVAEGRKRQDRLATSDLKTIVQQLNAAGYMPAVAALLVNRAGWINDLLGYSLAWAEHVPVAEALAVRDALRFASGQCSVPVTELDEKSLPDLATAMLDKSPTDIATRLKALGAPIGKPWRKEQKLACLSAWVAVTRLH
jgi:hypothetical protein